MRNSQRTLINIPQIDTNNRRSPASSVGTPTSALERLNLNSTPTSHLSDHPFEFNEIERYKNELEKDQEEVPNPDSVIIENNVGIGALVDCLSKLKTKGGVSSEDLSLTDSSLSMLSRRNDIDGVLTNPFYTAKVSTKKSILGPKLLNDHNNKGDDFLGEIQRGNYTLYTMVDDCIKELSSTTAGQTYTEDYYRSMADYKVKVVDLLDANDVSDFMRSADPKKQERWCKLHNSETGESKCHSYLLSGGKFACREYIAVKHRNKTPSQLAAEVERNYCILDYIYTCTKAAFKAASEETESVTALNPFYIKTNEPGQYSKKHCIPVRSKFNGIIGSFPMYERNRYTEKEEIMPDTGSKIYRWVEGAHFFYRETDHIYPP